VIKNEWLLAVVFVVAVVVLALMLKPEFDAGSAEYWSKR